MEVGGRRGWLSGGRVCWWRLHSKTHICMHTLTRCSCLCLCLLHAESLCYIAFRFMATLTVCVCVVCLLLAAPGCRPHAAAAAAALYPTLPALDIQGLLLALLLFCSAHRVLQQHREEKKLVSISVLQLYVTQLRLLLLLLLKTVLCCVCVSLAYTYDASAFCYLLFFAKMTQTHMYTHTHTISGRSGNNCCCTLQWKTRGPFGFFCVASGTVMEVMVRSGRQRDPPGRVDRARQVPPPLVRL